MSFELNPYKFILFVIDKALAIDIEALIPENFPGPWLTNILSISLIFILHLSKSSKRKIIKLSKFSLLFG